jgi:hypothetical protein
MQNDFTGFLRSLACELRSPVKRQPPPLAARPCTLRHQKAQDKVSTGYLLYTPRRQGSKRGLVVVEALLTRNGNVQAARGEEG